MPQAAINNEVTEKRPLLADRVDVNNTTNVNTTSVTSINDDTEHGKKTRKKNDILVLILMLLVVGTGATNSVARKIMTQPMGNYSLFVTLFNAAAYTMLYQSIMATKYCLRAITPESIKFPWVREKKDKPPSNFFEKIWRCIPPVKYFILIGFLECFGNILQIIATPYLDGPMISLLSQTTIFFSMIVSAIMFKARYSVLQVIAVLVVVGGAMIPLIHTLVEEGGEPSVSILYYIIMAISSLPMTISFAIKERIFKNNKGLDIFVVNGTGSMFQLLWWPFLLPITILLNQTGGLSLPKYLENAFECFSGHTPLNKTGLNCGPNPYPYLIYISLNLCYNIIILLLIKRASAVQTFIALNGVLPAAVLLYWADWPLIGSIKLDIYVIFSLLIVMIGLVVHRLATIAHEQKERKLLVATT